MERQTCVTRHAALKAFNEAGVTLWAFDHCGQWANPPLHRICGAVPCLAAGGALGGKRWGFVADELREKFVLVGYPSFHWAILNPHQKISIVKSEKKKITHRVLVTHIFFTFDLTGKIIVNIVFRQIEGWCEVEVWRMGIVIRSIYNRCGLLLESLASIIWRRKNRRRGSSGCDPSLIRREKNAGVVFGFDVKKNVGSLTFFHRHVSAARRVS
jgi:hypothetical protein